MDWAAIACQYKSVYAGVKERCCRLMAVDSRPRLREGRLCAGMTGRGCEETLRGTEGRP